MKTKKTIAIFTIFSYLLCAVPVVVHAEDHDHKITTLRQGQKAPYAGTLFNTSAAAKLQVDLQFTEETCKLETDRQIGLLRSKLSLDIDLLKAQLKSEKTLYLDTLRIKNKQIQFLEGYSLERKWHSSNEFWLVTGLVSGIIVTAIAGWSLGQANN